MLHKFRAQHMELSKLVELKLRNREPSSAGLSKVDTIVDIRGVLRALAKRIQFHQGFRHGGKKSSPFRTPLRRCSLIFLQISDIHLHLHELCS